MTIEERTVSLYMEHRPSGSSFWHELNPDTQRMLINVVRAASVFPKPTSTKRLYECSNCQIRVDVTVHERQVIMCPHCTTMTCERVQA